MAEPRSFGSLLKDSFRLLRTDAGLYAPLVLISVAPALALTLLVPASRSKAALEAALQADQAGVVLLVAFGGLLSRLIDSFVGVAAILAAHERDQGGSPVLSGALKNASGAYWTYLTTGLLALAWIVGGLFLLIVPGLLLALRYVLIPYAVLLEGRAGKEALARSSALCKAMPGKIYGNLLAAAVAIVVCGGLAGGAIGLVSPPAADEILVKLVDGLAGTWLAVFAVLLYKDVVKAVE